jgi:hypothetical protein
VGDFMKQSQSPPKLTQTDPFVKMRPQQQMYENWLRGATTGSNAGQIGGLGVGPRPEQTQALQDLSAFTGRSMPLYDQSVGELERVAGGQYLDPTQAAPYQRYRETQQDLANMLFGQQAGLIGARRPGAYNTSARLQQVGAAGAGTAGETAGRVGQAGYGLYGAERGRQEAAAQAAMNLAPDLSQQIFGYGEKLRAAEQQANIDQAQAQLAGMGLDQNTLELALKYLRSATGHPEPYIRGPSPWEQTNELLGSLAGGGVKMGGFGQGSATTPYQGTIYGASGGWATPRYQE